MIQGQPTFSPINDEFSLIAQIATFFPTKHKALLQGIGDDAAVWKISDTDALLVSTDLMAQGVHFDLSYVPLHYLGYKAAITNFSDIYAMHAFPQAITVSLAVDKRTTQEAVLEIYRGIQQACAEHEVDLIGGDTSTTRGGMLLSITVFGTQKIDKIVYRKGAQVNDLICVSGDIGAAYAGLQILEREKSVFLSNPNIQPDLSGNEYVVERQLRPRARKDIIDFFMKENIRPTAMIDVSDGLAADLHHLCSQSQKGALIFQNKLPIDYQTQRTAEDFNRPELEFALYGGEDYELLFTLNPNHYPLIQNLDFITPIGYIRPDLVQIEFVDGSVTDLQPMGWNHFQS